MKCEEAKPLLDLHLDGDLPLELSVKMDKHLLRCPHCAGELRTLEQTRTLLREAVPQAAPSPAFRERAAARLHAELSVHLRPAPDSDASRQWTLPFSRNEV